MIYVGRDYYWFRRSWCFHVVIGARPDLVPAYYETPAFFKFYVGFRKVPFFFKSDHVRYVRLGLPLTVSLSCRFDWKLLRVPRPDRGAA